MNLNDIIKQLLPEGTEFKIFENKSKTGLNIQYNLSPDLNIVLQDYQLSTLSAYCQEHSLFASLFFDKSNKQMICINKSKPRVEASKSVVNSYFD